MELSLFSKYETFTPNEKKVNTRAMLIQKFVYEINKERPCTYEDKNGIKKRLGKTNARTVAILLGHIKDEFSLSYFLSDCKGESARGKSFSKVFFGSLK